MRVCEERVLGLGLTNSNAAGDEQLGGRPAKNKTLLALQSLIFEKTSGSWRP